MKKILEWIAKHKKLTVVIFFALIFLPIIFIHFLFKIQSHCYWIEAEWSAGEALGYFGDVLSFIGTVVLGWFAIEQTEKAHKLNTELMHLEKNKIKPCFDIVQSQLYKIYLGEAMEQKLKSISPDKETLINVLHTCNQRTGLTTNSALIELEVTNSGFTDIRNIYLKKTLLSLLVCDPFAHRDETIAMISGDTSLKKEEKKTFYIRVYRECIDDNELDDYYTNNINALMPHIEFELILKTVTGDLYKENISCGSSWNINLKNDNKIATRLIGIIDINVSEETIH